MSESEQGPPAPDVDPAGMTEIAGDVWMIPDRRIPLVPNIGIVGGREKVLVIDAGMGPQNGARILEAAQEKAQGRSLLATSTHFHPEHGFGLQVFREAATILYNDAQLDELHTKGQAYVDMFRPFGPTVAAALDGVELVDPHETYSGERHVLDLGGRTVELLTHGLAHTKGDQVAFLPEERILFTGDLVEFRFFPIYPYFPPDDADVDGTRWIQVLRWLESLEPRHVVPGHGEMRDLSVILEAREYHERLRTETFELVDAGVDADEAVTRLESPTRERHPDWEQPEWIAFGIRCFHAERMRSAQQSLT
jgi:glyoxylase-like metal-dependent hydrolase (beta-lactamase superfamily II)